MKILRCFALEFRKHRGLLFQSQMLLAMVFGILLAILRFNSLATLEAIQLELFLMLAYGAVVFPCVFGAATGSMVRREPLRSQEEVLPLSHRHRIIASFVTGLLLTALLLFLLFSALSLLDWGSYHWYWPYQLISLAWVLNLLIASYTIGYLRKYLLRAVGVIISLAVLELIAFQIPIQWARLADLSTNGLVVWSFSIAVATVISGLLLLARISRKLN